MGGAKPNTWKACWTKACPTPWKEECTTLRGEPLFATLTDMSARSERARCGHACTDLGEGLPVEAEGGQLVHVTAVDPGQRVAAQRAALPKLRLPAGGAPRLLLLLHAAQDLLILRGGHLSTGAPVHLWGSR